MARLSTHLEPRILCTIGFIGIALSMLALTTINLDITNTRLVLLRIFTTIGVSFIFVPIRSEEHTSELQSLMRISYAVFCLKKKKHPKTPYKPRYLATT